MDVFGFDIQPLTTFMQGLSGFMGQQQGVAMQVSGYRTAAQNSYAAAKYNAKLVDFQLNRQYGIINKQIRQTMATQRSAYARSGVSLSSKSALSTVADSLNTFERQIVQMRNSAQIEKEQIIYQGRVAQYNANQQADFAESQGRSQMWQNLPSLISQGVSAFRSFS